VNQPGALLASGRDADIFEYGPGLVLRRSREGRSMAGEAQVMEYARSHGYPVPAIEEISADGAELVMERIEGPSMVEVLGRRPWALGRYAEMLADLHKRLHLIPAPDGASLAVGKAGDCLLHLDLHPLNVMLGPTGPVVIDWSNAASGDWATDVALTWVLMAAGGIPAGRTKAALLGRFRKLLVARFLGHFDLPAVKEQVRVVVEWKVRDPHMTEKEQHAMWRIAGTSER
jgi:aminoglycoside phosphotransferase (APT) family kinase protein